MPRKSIPHIEQIRTPRNLQLEAELRKSQCSHVRFVTDPLSVALFSESETHSIQDRVSPPSPTLRVA